MRSDTVVKKSLNCVAFLCELIKVTKHCELLIVDFRILRFSESNDFSYMMPLRWWGKTTDVPKTNEGSQLKEQGSFNHFEQFILKPVESKPVKSKTEQDVPSLKSLFDIKSSKMVCVGLNASASAFGYRT